MVNNNPESSFWKEHYDNSHTPWDIGTLSRPLKEYFDQLENKDARILIPGSGFSYEAEHLYLNGFQNIIVVDLAEAPLRAFKKRCPQFPKNQIIQGDFFKLEDSFDLIIEQTFFCALHPELRPRYVQKMHELLTVNGRLAGLLFNFPLTREGPPYGGNIEMYEQLFSVHFTIEILEPCYNSIAPRQGNELFFQLRKERPD